MKIQTEYLRPRKWFKIPFSAKQAMELEHLLPSMGRFSEEDYREDKRVVKLFESIDGFLRDVDNILAKVDHEISSEEHNSFYKNREFRSKELVELLTTVNRVLRRCVHSVVRAEKYSSADAGVLAIFWRAAACFSPMSLGYEDIEMVDQNFQSSRYLLKKERVEADSWKSRSYYETCRRMLQSFPWASGLDRKIFAAYCDGFSVTEISVFVGESLAYVERKLNHYLEIVKNSNKLGML